MRAAAVSLSVLLSLAAPVRGDETSPPRPKPGNVSFVYPEEARQRGVTGPVFYSAEVDERGAATAVKIRATPGEGLGFETAVDGVVRQWRFEPAMVDDKPVPGTYDGSVAFRLFPEDEKQIEAAVARLAAAWNAHAADQVVTQIAATDPGDPMAALVRPLDAERAWITEQFAHDAPLAAAPRNIQFLSLAAASAEISRAGTAEPLTALFGKREGRWALVRVSAFAKKFEIPPNAVRVGQGIMEPRKTKNVSPHYPDEAKLARVQGTVILEATIDPQGDVVDLKVLRGLPMLNESAIKAVRQWKYTPTLLDGVAVPVIMTVTVTFRLR